MSGKRWALVAAALLIAAGCMPKDPRDIQRASVHYNLGNNYLNQGDPTSALRELLEAEKLNDKDPHIQYSLGLALNAKGRYKDSLEHYRKALSLDPKYTEVHNAMGATYLELGEWDAAIQEFNAVLKDLLYQTPFYVENNLGWAYYKKGDLQSAIGHYRNALRVKPDFGLAHYNLALALRDSKQIDQAILEFNQAATLVPGFADTHFQLGKLYLETGKKKEAQQSFEEVVRLAPQSDNARMSREYLELLKKAGK
ncbi:MAG TPA: tetratricopeptide repeat protein [Thermodesulfobacteriota bacterium]|nr:tetratricopeptide repeat protein [Thermodesulfobacteriota bacterium]